MKRRNFIPTRSRHLLLIPFLALILAFAGWGSTAYGQTSTATVMTDRADYLPGEIVVITGTGWQADERVDILIEHLVFDHPDEGLFTFADASGNISDESYTIDNSDLGETFLLTATGKSSGFTATASFTDGPAADGDGTMVADPADFCTGPLDVTFKFRAPNGKSFAAGSQATFAIPSGWPIAGWSVFPYESASIQSSSIDVYNTITVDFTAPNKDGFDIVFSNVNDLLPNSYFFQVKTKQNGGALIDLTAGSPTVTIPSAPVGGTVGGSTTSCKTSANTAFTLTGYSGTSLQWQESTDKTSWEDVDGKTGTDCNGHEVTMTTYFRVSVMNGSCGPVYSSIGALTITSLPDITADPIENLTSFTVSFGEGEDGNVTINSPTTYVVQYLIGADEITSPYEFDPGSTTVTVKVTNFCGTVTKDFVVTTGDPPVISGCEDVTKNNDSGKCTAVVTYDVSATGTPEPTYSYSFKVNNEVVNSGSGTGSGETFGKGITEVTVTATNDADTDVCTFDVTVVDNEAPTIICATPAASYAADADVCTYTVPGTDLDPTTTGDNCSVASVLNDFNNAASLEDAVFPLGSTTVIWTVTDGSGRLATCSYDVVVVDTQDPVITAPDDITKNNDAGVCGAVVSYVTPVGTDICSVATTEQIAGLASGSTFPVGTTTNTFKVTDAEGLTAVCSFKVTVLDTEVPVITAEADIEQTADPGRCQATVTVIPPAVTDNCDQNIIPMIELVTNGNFNSGNSHWIDCDNTAEVLTERFYIVPAPSSSSNYVAEIDAEVSLCQNISGFTVDEEYTLTFEATRRQNVTTPNPVSALVTIDGGALSQVVTRTNTFFALTPVSYKFKATQTTHTLTFTHYTDNLGTLGIIIDDISIKRSNANGAVVGTRSDELSLAAAYPVGTTTITWTATDIYGNAAVAVNQQVTVTDNEKPVITAEADITQTADAGLCSAVVTIVAATATDNCAVQGSPAGVRDDEKELTDPYPVGTTTITWTVSDIHGNAAVAKTQTVAVTDDENPSITCPTAVTAYSSDDGKGNCTTTVALGTPTIGDNCDVAGTVAKVADAVINPATYAFPVGPTTVTWVVTDIHFNSNSCTQLVTVTDDEVPTISCVADQTRNVNTGGCTYTVTGSEFNPIAYGDNCSGYTIQNDFNNSNTLDGAIFNHGSTKVTWTVTDASGLQTPCSFIVTVKIPTVTTAFVSAPNARYADEVTLYAEVSGICSTYPLFGKVQFEIDYVEVGEPVDVALIPVGELRAGNYRATFIYKICLMPKVNDGSYIVTASFTPDPLQSPDYLISTSTNNPTLKVYPREPSVFDGETSFYMGDLFGWTTNATTNTATVTLAALIQDNTLPVGDVRGARVTFKINGSPIPSAQNLPVNLIDLTDGTRGAASAIVQLSVANLNSAAFKITVEITGGYKNDPTAAISEALVTISRPVPGGYFVGGGTLSNAGSSGWIKGATPLMTGFHFDVKYTNKGTNPQGSVIVNFSSYYNSKGMLDGKLHDYEINSNAIATLNLNALAYSAYFSSKATLQETTGNVTTSIEGGSILQLWLHAKDGVQTLGIQLNRKAGGIWYSSNWTGVTTEKTIEDGLIYLSITKAGFVDDGFITSDDVKIKTSLLVYPNPSPGPVTFRFILDESAMATIDILSSTGQVVQRAWDGYVKGGEYQSVNFEGKLAQGLYFIQLRSGSEVKTERLVVSRTY